MGTTLVERLFAFAGNLTGKFIRVVGGAGTNGFIPSPGYNSYRPSVGEAGVLNQDSVGSLSVRGQTLTDEGSFTDDFLGSSLSSALTGTPTFTNGSTTVTGVGTLFTEEVNTFLYVKRNSDTDANWTRVAQVLSDTELELASPYPGTTGGSASSKSNWIPSIGSGGSITIGSSLGNVISGTTNGSATNISREIDYMPLHASFAFSVSQRIANQSITIGFKDDLASPTVSAIIVIDGTVNTTIKFRSQSSAAAADIQEVTVTLPFGLTTNTENTDDIDINQNSVSLQINGLIVATLTRHVPDPYALFYFVVEAKNTAAPGSSTTVSVNLAQISNYNQVQIANISTSSAIPVQIREEVHYVTGSLTTTTTTADQVVVSFTVPANKVAYVVGYSVSVDGNTDALPVKVGKNTVTTVPAAPGTQDGNILRTFRMNRSSAGAGGVVQEDFSAMPRPLGKEADVLKITVTPSGTGSTIWRATFDIVLRPV